MKLVQCPNKHYYDADKYKECPICHPVTSNRVEPSYVEDDEDKTVALNEADIPASVTDYEEENTNDEVRFDPMTGKPLGNEEVQDDEVRFDPMTGKPLSDEPSYDDEVRFDPMTGEPLGQTTVNTDDEVRFDPMTGEPLGQATVNTNDGVRFDPMTGKPLGNTEVDTNDEVRFDPMTGESLKKEDIQYHATTTTTDNDETQPVSAETETLTFDKPESTEEKPVVNEESLADVIAHASTTISDDDDATIPFYASKDSFVKGRGYVVGWLVGVKGSAKGMSFNLYAGKNSIGRSQESDVVIDRDRSVARVKHAIVIYDPKNNDFIALPGESKELYYINGDLVLTPTPLKAHDRLSLGESELMLVPLCDETFNWDQEKDD